MEKIKYYISRYRLHFILFWVLLYMALVVRFSPLEIYNVSLILNFSFITVTASFSYFVLFYMLPRSEKTKKMAIFFIITCILLILVSLFNSFSEHYILVNFGEHPVRSGYFNQFPSKLVATTLCSAAFSSLKLADDYLNARLANEKLKRDKIAAELEYLKVQLDPHFLFNTLNNLYFLAETNPPKTSESILKLSEILRFRLYDSNSRMVTLEKEIENINNYIELEKIRINSSTKIICNYSGITQGLLIAPYTLLPLVENAFKHLSSTEEKPGKIMIGLTTGNGNLTFSVKNSCDSRSDNTNRNYGGLGVKNLKRRLEILYPGKYSLVTADNKTVFEVILKIVI